MKIFKFPTPEEYPLFCERPIQKQSEKITAVVNEIFDEISQKGDVALLKYRSKFEGLMTPLNLNLETIPPLEKDLESAILEAYQNILTFHSPQLELESPKITTTSGVECWRVSRAIENVGLYIPGGTAPLFSTVLMLGVPAKIAGCKTIILCSPSNHPAILYCAKLVGVTKYFQVGGAHAIAAMGIGTESIPKVDKIFGPGNSYVTTAKQKITQLGVGIDLPAGPSEVLVIADKTANPAFVAADLLAQAEHGEDSQVLCITDDEFILEAIQRELNTQIKALPRAEIIKKAMENSSIILTKNINEAITISTIYAPEHLILAVENPEFYLNDIQNAGSIFLGHYTPESAGDYASGTNHTLPTAGYAKMYSGVSVDSFVKKITVQSITNQGIINLGKTIETLAKAENLEAHKNAVSLRLEALKNTNQ